MSWRGALQWDADGWPYTLVGVADEAFERFGAVDRESYALGKGGPRPGVFYDVIGPSTPTELLDLLCAHAWALASGKCPVPAKSDEREALAWLDAIDRANRDHVSSPMAVAGNVWLQPSVAAVRGLLLVVDVDPMGWPVASAEWDGSKVCNPWQLAAYLRGAAQEEYPPEDGFIGRAAPSFSSGAPQRLGACDGLGWSVGVRMFALRCRGRWYVLPRGYAAKFAAVQADAGFSYRSRLTGRVFANITLGLFKTVLGVVGGYVTGGAAGAVEGGLDAGLGAIGDATEGDEGAQLAVDTIQASLDVVDEVAGFAMDPSAETGAAALDELLNAGADIAASAGVGEEWAQVDAFAREVVASLDLVVDVCLAASARLAAGDAELGAKVLELAKLAGESPEFVSLLSWFRSVGGGASAIRAAVGVGWPVETVTAASLVSSLRT